MSFVAWIAIPASMSALARSIAIAVPMTWIVIPASAAAIGQRAVEKDDGSRDVGEDVVVLVALGSGDTTDEKEYDDDERLVYPLAAPTEMLLPEAVEVASAELMMVCVVLRVMVDVKFPEEEKETLAGAAEEEYPVPWLDHSVDEALPQGPVPVTLRGLKEEDDVADPETKTGPTEDMPVDRGTVPVPWAEEVMEVPLL
ncbi:hypothetical protein M406DRAFT_335052 [Cryphonectria parasitica EP155]|uniref:Uncharacterized protein n=1 Tax=Cryphonectria parasitica (strain ATCC 38755 / EP155) TaxID=660469 RepID=A0A9P5CHX7_CRYP1|nr:uncharacterized protein M406DRAFT_335052 [Cryphonectria parasitica EP155]KAF3760384.1 hypothetical protein M406DRAFT_335052 [Cryphonectria parasitica EP155]